MFWSSTVEFDGLICVNLLPWIVFIIEYAFNCQHVYIIHLDGWIFGCYCIWYWQFNGSIEVKRLRQWFMSIIEIWQIVEMLEWILNHWIQRNLFQNINFLLSEYKRKEKLHESLISAQSYPTFFFILESNWEITSAFLVVFLSRIAHTIQR